jgi:hypothetical protein
VSNEGMFYRHPEDFLGEYTNSKKIGQPEFPDRVRMTSQSSFRERIMVSLKGYMKRFKK